MEHVSYLPKVVLYYKKGFILYITFVLFSNNYDDCCFYITVVREMFICRRKMLVKFIPNKIYKKMNCVIIVLLVFVDFLCYFVSYVGFEMVGN